MYRPFGVTLARGEDRQCVKISIMQKSFEGWKWPSKLEIFNCHPRNIVSRFGGSKITKRGDFYAIDDQFLYMLVRNCGSAPLPLRVTIDCSASEERPTFGGSGLRASSELFNNRRFDVNSFCSLIHNAIPKAVQDGKFILLESDTDQTGFSDTQVPISVPPPEGFIPKLTLSKWKRPKLNVPIMKVPKLRPQPDTIFTKPRLGSSISWPVLGDTEEDSSAEKMERIKKGIQKLLHVVKVLGQIDQYLSERTRIVIDKISKTLAE